MRGMRFLIVTLAMWLTGAAMMVGAADVAVVDMDRLVKAHPKSDVNREILRDQFKELENEKAGMLETLQGKKEAFMDARRQASDPAIGDAVREERQAEAADMLKALQELEREMGQRLMERQREITDQKVRMYKVVEDAVRELVAEAATQKKLVLVVDKSALSMGGASIVVFHKDRLDITGLILGEIDKLRE